MVAGVEKTRSAAGVWVYNFIVQDDHTYFVGNNDEWVHNGWPCFNGHFDFGGAKQMELNFTTRFHHIFPQAKEFEGLWDGIKIDDHTVEILEEEHNVLHQGPGPGGNWNQAWRDFFSVPRTNQEIMQQGLKMKQDAGFGNLPFQKYPN